MNTEENRNKFLFPRSYVGRAILYLFSVPFVQIIIHYIYSTISFAIGAIRKYIGYCNGSIERPREYIYGPFMDEAFASIHSYLRHFVISQMENVYVYFDVIFTTGVFAFIAWICLRYTRNGAFGKKEWFKTFVYSRCLWLAFIVCSVAFAYMDGLYENIPHLLTDEIGSLIYHSVVCVVSCYIAYVYFIKIPYDCEPIWKNEYKSGELLNHNIKFFYKKAYGKLTSKSSVKIVLIILGLFVLDLLYWTFKTI